MLFLAMFFILARLGHGKHGKKGGDKKGIFFSNSGETYLFWNQICTDRSVMLMDSAIRSLVRAVGVGFLLNSCSKVMSWS